MTDRLRPSRAGKADDPRASETAEPPVVDIRDISLSYRRNAPVLDGIDLVIQPGEVVGLVGESGSGKSTLGRLTLGLATPSRGQVTVLGRPTGSRSFSRLRGRLGVVLQNPSAALNPRMRVENAVAESCTAEPGDRREAARTALEMVGLDAELARRLPSELSGGQCQRVAVARALVNDPEYVVFDEAVSALDVSIQVQVLNLITDAQEEKRFSALFISHDLAAVRYVCDRIAVLQAGELVEVAESQRFYDTPEHPYSRELLAASDI